MDPLVKAALVANGIFRSRDSGGFRCSLCMSNADFFDWKKHTRDLRHSAIWERFKINFTNDGKMLGCKLCDESFDCEALSYHARSHKLIPWYVPIDRYKIFFENHILQWETQFYCYPCDAFFPEWSSALVHTNDDKHKNLVKMEVPVNDLSSWNTKDIPYELLVNEGFVTWAATSFKCTICNRLRIDLEHVIEHVEGSQHTRYKVGFVREMKDWKRIKMLSLKSTDSATETESEIPEPRSDENDYVRHLSPSIYVIQCGPTNFMCKICNIELPDRPSVDNHARGIPHLTNMRRYGCDSIIFRVEDREYFCNCCDCRILGIDNVFLHVMGTRHAYSLLRMKNSTEPPQEPNDVAPGEKDIAEHFEPASLPKDHIVKLDDHIVCRICSWIIVPNATDDHVTGVRHEKSVRQFYENITSCRNKYRCKSCDCTILSVEKLYRHLKGNRHADSIKKLDTKAVESNENEIGVESKEAKAHNHIIKINNEQSCCKICDCEISQAELDSHVRGNDHALAVEQFCNSVSHVKSDKYWCKDCECSIRGIGNVYLHIHGTRHCPSGSDKRQEKLGYERNKNVVKNAIESSMKEQPEVVKNENSDESIFKKNPVNQENNIALTSLKNSSSIAGKDVTEDNNDCVKIAKDSMRSLSLDAMIRENSPSKSMNNGENSSPRSKVNNKRLTQFFDPENDNIHNMTKKLGEIELGMRFGFANDSNIIYCIICRKEIGENWQNYYDHLWSLEHCEYLEGMEKDADLFELVPGQFSELDLALWCMEEISEDTVHCHVCKVDIPNVDYSLRNHISGKVHENTCNSERSKAQKNLKQLELRINCDWYKIYNYSCVPCSMTFQTDLSFANHLTSMEHSSVLKKLDNNARGLIYDFCEKCSLLWYGVRSTYANHCENEAHKSNAMSNEDFRETNEFEDSTKFSKSSLEEFIRQRVQDFDEESVKERERKIKNLSRNIENGLSVENAKLIKFFNDAFPPCQKLLLLLEEWLKTCGLSGSGRITIYALYWCVIFFLQRESIFPNVVSVIAAEDDLSENSGWKFGASRNFRNKFSIEELLVKFFTVYANFDYRYDVACPLLGEALKKRDFADPQSLPEDMRAHIDFTKNSDDSESLRIDCPMCIQDPFDLAENLTKRVSKIDLSAFRAYCRRSSLAFVTDQ